MDNNKEITELSLCTGYGGIELGLKRVIPNLRTITYVEIEAFAIANLVEKMEKSNEWEGFSLDEAPVWTNLKTFPWHLYRGKVDIISGGFPCQPFSAAGKGKADEDPRHLFPHIRFGISTIKPAIVWLENVEGIVSAKLKGNDWNDPAGTPVLLHVIRELERLGYRATAVPVSSSEGSSPHQRNRWFICGVRGDVSDSDCWRREIQNKWNISGEQMPISNGCARGASDLEHSEHNGLYGAKIQRGTEKASINIQEGEKETCKPSRASRSTVMHDICRSIKPAGPGPFQYCWEPPRTISNSEGVRAGISKDKNKEREGFRASGTMREDSRSISKYNRKTEPSMGGNLNEYPNRVDNAELYETCDSRTDELRLLGNGVDPKACERAFRLALKQLF